VENWEQWWAALAMEEELAPLLVERERRFWWKVAKDTPTWVETHIDALTSAGFREVGAIWQHLDNMVLMAVR
jgi:hypothetical protein